jgi:ECF sigma factor
MATDSVGIREVIPMSENLSWSDLPQLMDELKNIAQRLLSHEGRAQSLQPTALVLSALMRQVPGGTKKRDEINWEEITWENRDVLFRNVHRSMICALRDHARLRNTQRRLAIKMVRGEDLQIQDWIRLTDERPEEALALFRALDILTEEHPDWAEAIEKRYLEGLTVEETAAWMDKSEKTIRNWTDQARIFLKREILRIMEEEDLGEGA